MPHTGLRSRALSFVTLSLAALPLTIASAVLPLVLAPVAHAQEVSATAPVIDTVIINRSDVFPDSIAATSGIFRLMNNLHTVTRVQVIRKNLLFRQGQPFDSALVSQSERILRDLQIFSARNIDTATVDDRFAVIVNTRDGWSFKPKIKFAVASDGTVTATLGVMEINLLGTAILAQAYWIKEVNRNGADLALQWNRIYRRITAGFAAQLLSDGNNGTWQFGAPHYSSIDKLGGMYDGFAADRRVLQFVSTNETGTDSIEWLQDALINDFTASIASKARPRGYLRFGAVGQLRQEKFILGGDSGMSVPDTVRHDSKKVTFESYPALGFNYRMTDVQAAVGREQLKRLPNIVKTRRKLAQRYVEMLAELPGLGLPAEPKNMHSNWQSFCVRLPAQYKQRAVMQAMLDDGVSTRRLRRVGDDPLRECSRRHSPGSGRPTWGSRPRSRCSDGRSRRGAIRGAASPHPDEGV